MVVVVVVVVQANDDVVGDRCRWEEKDVTWTYYAGKCGTGEVVARPESPL